MRKARSNGKATEMLVHTVRGGFESHHWRVLGAR